jgi:hypothetical protein
MTVNNMTPDSVVLGQLDGHWQKLAAMLLWKIKGREMVRLTHEDIARFQAEFLPFEPVIFTHGHSDSIDFQIVTHEQAERLAAHDKTMRGTA